MNTSEKEIEANQPAEAVDSIEAIKDKILKAGHEVPLITNQVGWICLLNSGIISSDEKIAFTNHISKPTCAPQPAGKIFSYHALLLIILSASFPVTNTIQYNYMITNYRCGRCRDLSR
jgi:hypothetical protein